VAELQEQNAVLREKAKENPSGHVLTAANQTIAEIHPVVFWIFIASFVVSLIALGLMADFFNPTLQGIGKLIFLPAAGVASGSLATLFLLPFGFWVSIGGAAIGLGFGIWWCVAHFKQIKANIGAGTSDPAAPALVAAAKAVKVVAKA
jgi:hypothetical protein